MTQGTDTEAKLVHRNLPDLPGQRLWMTKATAITQTPPSMKGKDSVRHGVATQALPPGLPCTLLRGGQGRGRVTSVRAKGVAPACAVAVWLHKGYERTSPGIRGGKYHFGNFPLIIA